MAGACAVLKAFMPKCDDYRDVDAVGRNTVSLLREVHCHDACFV